MTCSRELEKHEAKVVRASINLAKAPVFHVKERSEKQKPEQLKAVAGIKRKLPPGEKGTLDIALLAKKGRLANDESVNVHDEMAKRSSQRSPVSEPSRYGRPNSDEDDSDAYSDAADFDWPSAGDEDLKEKGREPTSAVSRVNEWRAQLRAFTEFKSQVHIAERGATNGTSPFNFGHDKQSNGAGGPRSVTTIGQTAILGRQDISSSLLEPAPVTASFACEGGTIEHHIPRSSVLSGADSSMDLRALTLTASSTESASNGSSLAVALARTMSSMDLAHPSPALSDVMRPTSKAVEAPPVPSAPASAPLPVLEKRLRWVTRDGGDPDYFLENPLWKLQRKSRRRRKWHPRKEDVPFPVDGYEVDPGHGVRPWSDELRDHLQHVVPAPLAEHARVASLGRWPYSAHQGAVLRHSRTLLHVHPRAPTPAEVSVEAAALSHHLTYERGRREQAPPPELVNTIERAPVGASTALVNVDAPDGAPPRPSGSVRFHPEITRDTFTGPDCAAGHEGKWSWKQY
jgi:hypothetical protein